MPGDGEPRGQTTSQVTTKKIHPMKEYQSKLEPGQTAWLMRKNKIASMRVGGVTIKSVTDDEDEKHLHQTVNYGFRIYDTSKKLNYEWEEYPESLCFASKEELIASL